MSISGSSAVSVVAVHCDWEDRHELVRSSIGLSKYCVGIVGSAKADVCVLTNVQKKNLLKSEWLTSTKPEDTIPKERSRLSRRLYFVVVGCF